MARKLSFFSVGVEGELVYLSGGTALCSVFRFFVDCFKFKKWSFGPVSQFVSSAFPLFFLFPDRNSSLEEHESEAPDHLLFSVKKEK